ncbi:MAG: Trigger factor [Chloroflexi bacterium ADurb.Bin360]|nr:MAG: Trigger factor [Chloroflexi bacterium ADurb.Bin360]
MFTISKEVLENCEALITVEIEESAVQNAMQKAARNIARENPFPGFRKGKVPYNMVVSRVGAPALRRDAAELLLDEIYADVLKQAEVEPVGPGSLDDIKLEPLVLKIRVPLPPVVELGEVADLRLDLEAHEVTDEELQTALEQLRNDHTTTRTVSRPAALGDSVTLEHVEAQANGEVFIHEHDVNLVLDPEDRNIVPGLVDALVGLSAGEEKLFHLTLPEDFSEPTLRNADAEFVVHVESVGEPLKPELDDAFASVVGKFETLDDLKADLRERMEAYKHEQAHEAYHEALLAELLKRAKVQFPEVLLGEELDEMLKTFKVRIPQQLRMSWEDFLRLQGTTEEQFRESLRPRASKSLTEKLVLEEFARREQITVSEEDLRDQYARLLDQLEIPNNARRPFSRDLVVVEESYKQLLHGRAMAALERLAQGLPAQAAETILPVEPDTAAA